MQLSKDIKAARTLFTQWRKPASIIGRRTAERDLFFDAVWPAYCSVLLYGVGPNMKLGKAKSVKIADALTAIWDNNSPTPEKVVEDAAATDRLSATDLIAGATVAERSNKLLKPSIKPKHL